MAGTNILVRQKDLIAGSGISITPDTTSGNVTIAATSTAVDESRLLPLSLTRSRPSRNPLNPSADSGKQPPESAIHHNTGTIFK